MHIYIHTYIHMYEYIYTYKYIHTCIHVFIYIARAQYLKTLERFGEIFWRQRVLDSVVACWYTFRSISSQLGRGRSGA